MGSSFSNIQRRYGISNRNMNDEVLYDGEDSDQEADLSMVLSLLIRPFGAANRLFMDDADDDDVDEPHMDSPESGLVEPDSVKESDLKQMILNNLGELSNLSTNQSIANLLMNRERSCCGIKHKKNFSCGSRTNITSRLIPDQVVNRLKLSQKKLFCGTYSEDGNIFLSACQDGQLRVYRSDELSGRCKPFKTVRAVDIGWSVLDTAFSPDALYLTYSTWSSAIYISSIYDNEDSSLCSHRALDLRPEQHNFAIFSLQFSADNNEILCGANDGHLYIYNRNLDQRTSRIFAHQDDINAVCFAGQSSQILYSGGDDGLVHVWDRRSLSDIQPQSVGSLAGHLDGITFIDSLQDERYLLSNSKDQTIKLWDLRKFSSKDAQEAVMKAVSNQAWDYRWERPPRRVMRLKKTVEGDTSLKTYHGHRVRNTLLRARFSPLHTTGQKYIYCGCASGKVLVYDILTGDIVSQQKEHIHCVRDVSWHPFETTMVSSSWDGSFAVWDSKSASSKEEDRNQSKKRKLSQNFAGGDEETGEVRGQRRSPRLARW